MDLSILGSIATFIVALITLYNVLHLRRQLKLMEKQVILLRSEVYPFIDIKDKKVNGNEVELKLENKGRGPAFNIGFRTQFTPLKIIGSEWSFVDELYEYENEKPKRRIYPINCVVLLRTKHRQGSRLHPQEEDVFTGETRFMHGYSKKGRGLSWRYHSFEDLGKLFTTNKLRFVAVSLALVYQDITESIIEEEPLHFFVIDFTKHKSIEEAIKGNLPLPSHTVSLEEIGFIDWGSYKSMKSERSFVESPFKD
jgi:hypothetical protein